MQTMLRKGVIQVVQDSHNKLLSPIFLVETQALLKAHATHQ